MVASKTTTTTSGRRIVELEIPAGRWLQLVSELDHVPDERVSAEPGAYLLVRVGDVETGPGANEQLSAYGEGVIEAERELRLPVEGGE